MMKAEKINTLRKLSEELRFKNKQLAMEIESVDISALSTSCKHYGCNCPQYTKGSGDGICGTCFHPAYEHI